MELSAPKFITLYTTYLAEGTKNVTFQTVITSDYIKIKDQVRLLGFKFIKTYSKNGSTFFEYVKENYELSIASAQEQNQYGRFVTFYEISLTKTIE